MALTVQEGMQALQPLRKCGRLWNGSALLVKTILAYNMDWGQREYYLSSVANTIVLNPLGEMEVKGLSTVPMFMAGAFQKYGIGVQVVREGKFKGAVEPYLLTKLSPEKPATK